MGLSVRPGLVFATSAAHTVVNTMLGVIGLEVSLSDFAALVPTFTAPITVLGVYQLATLCKVRYHAKFSGMPVNS